MKMIDFSAGSINLEKLLNFAGQENILVRRDDSTVFLIAAMSSRNALRDRGR
ncbi:MAG: hypothetical protein SW833_28465 [Cyanobacteriota bacterium]|nr:hypothetical protein [Cyanobacteriota bacterium]